MEYILIQPVESLASLATIKYLTTTGEYLFDFSLDGSRLRPVLFESRDNIRYKRNCNSFVREVVGRRWSIAVYCKYFCSAPIIGYVTALL